MRNIRKKIAGVIPGYSLFPLILAFLFNTVVYNGARMIAGEWRHYNMESVLDRMIPFWPPAVLVYLGCYFFWAANYIIIARQRKREAYQFFKSDFISRIFCLICFLSFPTTNIRPFVQAEGFWNQVVLWLYSIDAADNLFPSIHCLISWLCYIGIRRKQSIPVWYRGFSCIMALLVCASTLLTKQHVLVDVIGGVLLAELCFYIGNRNEDTGIYGQIMDKINRRLRLEKGSV